MRGKAGKICFLWHNQYPWDIRIEKISSSLVTFGHKVAIICKRLPGQKSKERYKELEIFRIGKNENGFINRAIGIPLFFNPFWISETKNVLDTIRPDCIIVRDIPLALLACYVASNRKMPVVLDMAENYPAALIAYENKLYKPFLFSNAYLIRLYERKCLQRVSHIFVVAREQVERMHKLGIQPEKVTLVMNTPDIGQYNDLLDQHGEIAKMKIQEKQKEENKLNLIYVGKIDVHRGIDVLVKAIGLLKSQQTKVKLVLVGDGKDVSRIKQLVSTLNLVNQVFFEGWLSFDLVPSYIKVADVGVIPHLRSEHTETTVPNKIFDYMAMGKPVICSDIGPLARIIFETDSGIVFKNNDASDLANKILSLLHYSRRGQMGHNGIRSVKEIYNWGKDEERLIEGINQVLNK